MSVPFQIQQATALYSSERHSSSARSEEPVINSNMTELAPPPLHLIDQISPDTSDSECSDTHKEGTVQPTNRDVGKRVLYYSSADKKYKYGTLRFIGETEFSSGMWCGVELNNASGKNNGTCKGIRYFTCDTNHGVFVPLNKVEMDLGRRSRPNSTPSSRSSSVDRELKSGVQTASTTTTTQKEFLSLQQKLVNRLSAPGHKRGKNNNQTSSNNRRQPLKAFATKGVSREEPKEAKKLPPFKSGGMMKARSTENISKQSGGGITTPKMPSKKSSSERDLRGAGNKSSSGKKEIDKVTSRKLRGSCSDLLVADIKTPKDHTPKHSTVVVPRTSTPRDELAPDGCSSPDDDSGSNASQLDDTMMTKTPSVGERAFIQTPPTPKQDNAHPNTSGKGTPPTKGSKKLDTSGLESAPVLLIKNERSNPSYNQSTMASPEAVCSKQRYKNRPSGTATLSHPLTASHNTQEDDHHDNVVTQLLDPSHPLEGVTVAGVLAVLREQYSLNSLQREAHSTQLESLRREYSENVEKLERQHKTAVKELVERHQNEIMALNRAHVEELKRYR